MVSENLGDPATHHAGEGARLRLVGDDEVVRGEGAVLPVEGGEVLPLPGGPDHDLAAAHLVEVEGVERMPELEEHQVGRIDHVGDGANPAGLEPPGEPQGRGTDGYPLDHPGRVAGALLRGLDADRDRLGSGGALLLEGRGAEEDGPRKERGQLACDAQVGERVGPVGRDVDLEQHVLEAERPRDRHARGEVLRQQQKAARVEGEPELPCAAEHPEGLDAAELRLLDPHPAGQHRAHRGEGDQVADLVVLGAADDLQGLALPGVDPGQRELLGVGMALGGGDPRDHHPLEPLPQALHRLDLEPHGGEPARDLLRFGQLAQ